MKILLLATPNSNIGNGFLSKGACVCLEQAFPNAEIIETSLYPDYVADRYYTRRGRISAHVRQGQSNRTRSEHRSRMINIGELTEADLAVIPSCILSQTAFDRYFGTLKRIADKGTPLLFLGADAGDYEQDTIKNSRKHLKNLEPIGFVSRDRQCYDAFSDIVSTTYDGIDCAWFLDEWYSGPNANTDLTALTFDSITEPDLDVTGKIVRPDHNPLGAFQYSPPMMGKELIGMGPKIPENHFVSDSITDYLFIYQNASETHSDRLHACVPSLVFGNQAKL